ncbi:MAG TPA: DUF2842 domain-containing protein [Sphingomicrobium sp.]|jgi:membrane protein implicated in regulation of membrane protease activity|nr:DUF2842 domain-containing protein [Sphingomicrobium sp.]
MMQEQQPRSRPTAAAFMIIGIIVSWSALIVSLADIVGSWPWPVQALFYTIAGIIWIVPLKPILRWSETGRWRGDRS